MEITRKKNSKHFFVNRISGIIFILVALLFPYYLDITQKSIENKTSFCPLKLISGIPCPGCGVSKSIMYLYEGNFSKSIEHHLFGWLFLLILVYLLFVFTFELVVKKTTNNHVIFQPKILYIFGIILLIYYFYRLIFIF